MPDTKWLDELEQIDSLMRDFPEVKQLIAIARARTDQAEAFQIWKAGKSNWAYAPCSVCGALEGMGLTTPKNPGPGYQCVWCCECGHEGPAIANGTGSEGWHESDRATVIAWNREFYAAFTGNAAASRESAEKDAKIADLEVIVANLPVRTHSDAAWKARVERLEVEVESQRATAECYQQKSARQQSILADNICWMDADPVGARRLSPDEMKASCDRFIAQLDGLPVLNAGQMTIAQLTREVERLEAIVKAGYGLALGVQEKIDSGAGSASDVTALEAYRKAISPVPASDEKSVIAQYQEADTAILECRNKTASDAPAIDVAPGQGSDAGLPGTSSLPHKTIPIQVWVDCDEGIADMVLYLNAIPGVRTQASCQGTIGEGGPNPYRPQVMCTWTPEALARLQDEFDVVPEGNGSWGYVHPKE